MLIKIYYKTKIRKFVCYFHKLTNYSLYYIKHKNIFTYKILLYTKNIDVQVYFLKHNKEI